MSHYQTLRADCEAWVRQQALVSSTVAIVPIPGLDLGADLAILARMIEEINRRFGLTPQDIEQLAPATRQRLDRVLASGALIGKPLSRNMLLLMIKRAASREIAKQASKLIPGLGLIAAAGISYGMMRKLGYMHIADCLRVVEATRD